MAKLKMGILGPFTGKVGTVVGATVNGIHYMRAYVPKVRDARTQRQVAIRSAFSVASRMARHLAPLLRIVAPTIHRTTASNRLVRGLFREGLITAENGKMTSLQTDQLTLIAPDPLRSLPPLRGLAAQIAGSTVTLSWTPAARGKLACAVSAIDGASGGIVRDVAATGNSAQIALPSPPADGELLVLAYVYDTGTGEHSPLASLKV